MAENQQQNPEQQKGPFSPLQSGCAFVMLSNMIIYMAVLVFVLNMLDPSKLDVEYLSKRAFTARPIRESEEDTTYRRLSKEKREEQQRIQQEIIDASRYGPRLNASPAGELSAIDKRTLAGSRPDEPGRPKAALTEGVPGPNSGRTQSAKSRLYSVSIFPQATMRNTYSPYRLPTARTLSAEKYEVFPFEFAGSIDFPNFAMPQGERSGAYIYKVPNPIPDPVRGGSHVSAPTAGAESISTNQPDKSGTDSDVK